MKTEKIIIRKVTWLSIPLFILILMSIILIAVVSIVDCSKACYEKFSCSDDCNSCFEKCGYDRGWGWQYGFASLIISLFAFCFSLDKYEVNAKELR